MIMLGHSEIRKEKERSYTDVYYKKGTISRRIIGEDDKIENMGSIHVIKRGRFDIAEKRG